MQHGVSVVTPGVISPSWPGRKEKEADGRDFMGHTRSSVVSGLKKPQAKPGTMLHSFIPVTRSQRQAMSLRPFPVYTENPQPPKAV